jgi:DNA processing protein
MSPKDIENWLRLSLAGVPTAPVRGLLRSFGGPQSIFEAAHNTPEQLRSEFNITEKALGKLRDASKKNVAKELDAMEEHGIQIVQEHEYPLLLTQIGDDTPPFIFIRGRFEETDTQSVGIVGTRNLTEYGRGISHKFALELAQEGWTTVSGLARGIDTAAHRGALDGGGRTIAVTACGLDIVYPSENRDLMLEIESSGAVISEWCPGTPPSSWHFPARNRIIAGLSQAIIVVEAPQKSGAMITATFAAEHDRTVFAVPGNLHKPQSKGPHMLIKEGAELMESVADLLEYLGESRIPSPERQTKLAGQQNSVKPNLQAVEPERNPSRPAKSQYNKGATTSEPEADHQKRLSFSASENAIWLTLDFEPRHMDDLQADAGLTPGAANAALVLLELKGAAKRLPGNLFVKIV